MKKRMSVSLLIGLSLPVALLAQTYSVTTIAGPAKIDETSSASPVFAPFAVVVDGAGNVYFADTSAHRVRKIDAKTLRISTVAGTGVSGNSGDGGPAAAARLNSPNGLAFDSAGVLYISDTSNHRIRKIDSSGNMVLVAGTSSGFSGDNGLATAAQLNNPGQITFDSAGNLYIADRGNNRIRRIDKTTGKIYTAAGSSTSGFDGDNGPAILAKLNAPRGVAVDNDGNIYIADTGNHSIRKVTIKKDGSGRPIDSAGIITTVVGASVYNADTKATVRSTAVVDGTLGTNGGVDSPRGLTIKDNKLYIASQGKDRIRVLDLTTGVITGYPCALSLTCGMDDPQGIAFDPSGNLWVAESANNRISQIGAGQLVVYAGNGSGTLSSNLRGVTVDPTGHVVVTDTGNNTIRRIEADGSLSTLVGIGVSGFSGDSNDTTTPSSTPNPTLAIYARVNAPWGGTFDSAGNFYFADRSNRRIRKVDSAGGISSIAGSTVRVTRVNPDTLKPANANLTQGYNGDGKPATQGQLNNPDAVAIDNLGNIYIADESNHVIRRIDPTGILSTFAGVAPPCANLAPTYSNAAGDRIDVAGVGNTGTGPDCAGVSGTGGDGGLAINTPLNSPRGVAVDALGNVYISETSNNAIRVVNVDGTIDTVPGGPFSTPLGIAVSSDGILYVANSGANNIRSVNLKTGVGTIIAGGGTDLGDGADATKTRVQTPFAVGVDSQKNVYFTDQTGRVRKLSPAAK